MALRMTRAEYQKQYGVNPVSSGTSTLDTTSAPIRMTRAEYQAQYAPGSESKPGMFPIKEAGQGLVASWQQYPGKIKQDILEGSKDISKGLAQTGTLASSTAVKGMAKAGLRTAGDTAGVIFAPIGAILEATGVNKLTDYLANKINESPVGQILPNIPAVQNFAITHPNAEEDFSRALNLLFSKAETGKIEPKTAIPRTIEQVRSFAGDIRNIPEKVRTYQQESATKKLADEIAKIENSYVATRKANEFSDKYGAESRQRIAQTNVLADSVNTDGIIKTKEPGGAVDQYRKLTIDGAEGVVRENLIREGKKVNIKEVATELATQVYRSGLEGADLVKAIKGLTTELNGLKLRADEFGNIDLSKIHDAKIATTQNINYKTDSTPTIKYRKAKASAYKTLVEKKSDVGVEVNGKRFGIPEINKELGKYYEDIARLEALDGKRVKGGKLGKYTAQITGNIVGGAVGGAIGGLPGMAAGSVVGGETSAFLRGRAMSKTFGDTGVSGIPKNEVLAEAKAKGKLPPEVNLKKPDAKIGAPKGIVKSKEILKIERDIAKNVEQQKAAIKAGKFDLVATLKEVYQMLVQYLKDAIVAAKKNPEAGFVKLPFTDSTTPGSSKAGKLPEKGKGKSTSANDTTNLDPSVAESLRKMKGLSAEDIIKKNPDIQLKRDVPATDIHGNKVVIPEGEALTPYELKGNKILLQDGQTYIVSKNQYSNIKGNAISGEAKPFAPELAGTEETVKGDIQLETFGKNSYGVKGTDIAIEKEGNEFVVYDGGTEEGRASTLLEAKDRANNIVQDNYNQTPSTKYSQYQLPGGENYKEVLIKAQDKWDLRENGTEKVVKTFDTYKEAQNAMMGDSKKYHIIPTNGKFKSSHWDEPNVISHLRLNERTYNGKKVTFMEELQSDWAREARAGKTTATAPQLKNWQELSVKRALKEAVDNNSEYFAWINGEQTAARYNLSTQVKKINWFDPSTAQTGRKTVVLEPQGTGKRYEFDVNKEGMITAIEDGTPNDWKGKNIAEVIGKGVGERIVSSPKGTLEGEGLNIGGEWAKNLYDKQVKSIVEDLTGAKVENLDLGLPVTGEKEFFYDVRRMEAVRKSGANTESSATSAELKPSELKVGQEISKGASNRYIITDVLGDGKFKAVPKDYYLEKQKIDKAFEKFEKYQSDEYFRESGVSGIRNEADAKSFLEAYKRQQTFDISTKKTTQQGIKLTPEIKAKIKGEAPAIKASGKEPFQKTDPLIEEARKYKTAEEFVRAQETGVVPSALQKNIDEAKAKGLTTQQFIDSNIPSRGGKLFTLPPDEMSVLQKQIGVDISKPVAYNENKILKYLADAYEGKSLAKTASVDGLKLPATEAEKAKVIQFMRNKLDNKYSGGSVLPDTAQYERIRMLTPAELEREFKAEFKVASPNHYFQETQSTTKSQLISLWEQAQKGMKK